MKFNVGHFPIGTIFEYQVRDNHPEQRTVKEVTKNGPKSYLVICFEPSEMQFSDGTQMQDCINFSHITRIIKRGNGPVVWRNGENVSKPTEQECQNDVRQTQIYLGIKKSRNHYFTTNIYHHLDHVLKSLVNHTMLVNYEKLQTELIDKGAIKTLHYKGRTLHTYIDCDKKKFKKAVKQALPRCLVKHAVAQREQDRMYDEHYDDHSDFSLQFDDDPMFLD